MGSANRKRCRGGKAENGFNNQRSKAAQDEQAITDVTTYIKKRQSYDLTDAGALIYFADGVSQYGTASAL